MAYPRTKRIAEEIRKLIGQMLYEGQIKDRSVLGSKSLISVTSVDVVRDLRYAYVYISVLGNDASSVMEGLASAAGYVRREVGKALKLRYTPEIVFRLDDSIEKGAYLSQLIREVNQHSHTEDEELEDGSDSDGIDEEIEEEDE